VLDKRAESDAGLGFFRRLDFDVFGAERADIGDAAGGDVDVARVTLQADEVAAEQLGDGAGRARAEERIEDHVAGIGGADDDAVEQGFGLLRRM
jgi:hypothetical protein